MMSQNLVALSYAVSHSVVAVSKHVRALHSACYVSGMDDFYLYATLVAGPLTVCVCVCVCVCVDRC